MKIYNVIILDESGSVSSIYKSTLSSINEVLGGIRREQEEQPEQENNVSIVTFEGNGMQGVGDRLEFRQGLLPEAKKCWRISGQTRKDDPRAVLVVDVEI